MKRSPFVVGQWVRGERFYGRAQLIDEILEGPRDNLWLLGTRRIGKTSLLKQLELLCSDGGRGFFPLFWDLQGADEPGELHASFAESLCDAEERLETLGLSLAAVDTDDLFSSIGQLRRRLRESGLRLLLLLDEAEALVGLHRVDATLLPKLRHVLQSSGGVRTVLASTIRLWALADQRDDTSPFLHGFGPPLYIGSLAEDEARALLAQRNLEPVSRPRFDRDVANAIVRNCDAHPYLLQLVGKRYLELGDLPEAIDQVACDRMVSYFFAVDFGLLESPERLLLRTVGREGRITIAGLEATLELDAATLRAMLQSLRNLGFIRCDDRGHFSLASPFFERWLAEAAVHSVAGEGGSPPARSVAQATLSRPPTRALVEDRYELLRKVGEGATGVVYEAYDRLLRTRIALKLLRSEYAGNRLVRDRFRREILLSRNLGHPNILRVYHLGEVEDRSYLTMQWVDGPSLGDLIAERGALPSEQVVFLGARLAAGLGAAHGRQVLHRDVKPQNIMLDPSGEPLITDFGLARLLEGPSRTSDGVFLGTPNYVSPEQANLDPVDGRSDLYSLGVVLFEMLTGRCPFRADSAAEVVEMHRARRHQILARWRRPRPASSAS